MARELSLSDAELAGLEAKLSKERKSLSDEDAKFLEIVIRKAKEARPKVKSGDVGWLFTWTYRF